jgi:carboxypeptidase PM20D1
MPSRQVEVEAIAPVPVDESGAHERLRGGLRIRTISPSDGDDRDASAFETLHAHLAAAYPLAHARLALERVGDLSLWYRWRGADPSAPGLVLMAHQDVVPVDAGTEGDWTHPPFAAVVDRGYVFGRGALDDKASLFGILEAVEDLLAAGFVPRADVHLAFGHDEELGGAEGARAIAERLSARDLRIGLVLDEGGSILDGRVVGLDRPVAAVGVAEKGYLSVILEARGEGGHSSAPPPRTAIGRLAAAVARIEQSPLPSRLDDTVRGFFEEGIGPESRFALRVVFANLWLFDPLLRAALDRVPGAGALVRTTTAPTIFHAGQKDNVLPARARAVVNSRVMPGESTDDVMAHVRAVVDDPGIRIEAATKRREPSRASRTEGPAWDALARSIREVFPGTVVAPYLVVAGTDARHFRGLCDCVYRFVPFRLALDDATRAHGTDERIAVDSIGPAVRFYRRLIERFAGSPADAETAAAGAARPAVDSPPRG